MIDEIVGQVARHRGEVVVVRSAGVDPTQVVHRLDAVLAVGDSTPPEVRLVLGAWCRTVAEALAQFVVALRLPYRACSGLEEFSDALGGRAASSRGCIVIADAQMLLATEPATRDELLSDLASPPRCMGGGWSTVVLLDSSGDKQPTIDADRHGRGGAWCRRGPGSASETERPT